jgi:hypothetical protein
LVVIGIDAHMRSHTAVAIGGGTGRQVAELTVNADEFGHPQAGRIPAAWAMSASRRSRIAATCPSIWTTRWWARASA